MQEMEHDEQVLQERKKGLARRVIPSGRNDPQGRQKKKKNKKKKRAGGGEIE